MPVGVAEYHPYAACLMFKQARNSTTVEANLAAVAEYGAGLAAARIRRELLAEIADLRFELPRYVEGQPGSRTPTGLSTRMVLDEEDVRIALDRICPEDGPPPACTWTQQDHEDGDCWETDCGGAFGIDEGAPSENGMRFCCYCGRPLAEQRFVPEPEKEGGDADS
jgi:hypothetical protein